MASELTKGPFCLERVLRVYYIIVDLYRGEKGIGPSRKLKLQSHMGSSLKQGPFYKGAVLYWGPEQGP